MKVRNRIIGICGIVAALVATALIVHSCGIYSFTGTSIQADVKTITIDYFEYKALQDKFRKRTRLEQVDMDGDLEITGAITGYDVRATAVTADEVAAQNRLTVTVKISFTNRKSPEDDFSDKSFSSYADYDSTQSLDAVEATLCEEIIEKICEDVFNATVANW